MNFWDIPAPLYVKAGQRMPGIEASRSKDDMTVSLW